MLTEHVSDAFDFGFVTLTEVSGERPARSSLVLIGFVLRQVAVQSDSKETGPGFHSMNHGWESKSGLVEEKKTKRV